MAWDRINRPFIDDYNTKFTLSSTIKKWRLKDMCVAGAQTLWVLGASKKSF